MTALYLSLAFAVCALFLWCIVFAPWIALAWFVAASLASLFICRQFHHLDECD